MARVCKTRQAQRQLPETTPHSQTSTRAIYTTPSTDEPPQINTAKVGQHGERAPTIYVHISSLNGAADLETLPDSGADISAAGKGVLRYLGEHEGNLLPSKMFPRAVNGTRMQPMGKLPITLQLGKYSHTEDLHIYPEVTGVLLSWKAAIGLRILPECYPHPSTITTMNSITAASSAPTSDKIMKEYPSVLTTRSKSWKERSST